MDIETIKVKLPLKNAPEYANVYIVNSEVMIDGGFISKQYAEELLEKAKDNVLITHHHIDHVGIIFWKRLNAYMHKLEIGFLKMYYKPESLVKPYIDWMNKYGIDARLIKPLSDAISSGKKDRIEIKAKINQLDRKIFDFEVLLTPGHSPGHVCFYGDKILFGGDLILSNTTTHVGYYPNYSENPMKEHINSLNKLLRIEIDVVYPAHERIIKTPEKRILELIEHYNKRIDEVYDALDVKPLKVIDIAKKINWHHSFDKLTGWDKLLAIGETLACLKYLEGVGKVKKIENGVTKFIKA